MRRWTPERVMLIVAWCAIVMILVVGALYVVGHFAVEADL